MDTVPAITRLAQAPLPKLLTPHAFYEAIGKSIGINTIYGYVRSGRLKSVTVGSRKKILATEVEDFFEREAGIN